jgi:hypothetical protein
MPVRKNVWARFGREVAGVALAIAAMVMSGAGTAAGWAQTQVMPPTSTRPQTPPAQTQSTAGPTSAGQTSGGQTSAGQTSVPQSGAPVRFLGPPVNLLDQVQQATQAASADLERVRIEKWKTGSDEKQQMQQVAQSLMRNLQTAMPGLVQEARAKPGNVTAQFKLYHNLSVLYEFYSSLTEAAGAFGSKQEYEPLARDAAALDQARQTLSGYIENLATQNDAELAKLRAAAQQQAQAAQQKPQKVIVDDEQPPPKKKSTTKKKSSTTTKPQ